MTEAEEVSELRLKLQQTTEELEKLKVRFNLAFVDRAENRLVATKWLGFTLRKSEAIDINFGEVVVHSKPDQRGAIELTVNIPKDMVAQVRRI